MDIWKFLNMQDPMGVRGVKKFVVMQHVMDIWKFLSGQNQKGVRIILPSKILKFMFTSKFKCGHIYCIVIVIDFFSLILIM